tara:strand:+ start:382 stop:1254 length:873 start_codon:yes stop_codon:yes gene_type:complete
MVEIGTVTLFREKSVVHKFTELSDDANASDEPVLELRSNRVTIPVKTKMSTVMVVVRGQNIPSTMRMTSVVVDEIRRDANVLRDAVDFDWDSQWRRKISKYEADNNAHNWISVHVGGEQAYASREDQASDEQNAIAEIELLADGEEVSEAIVMEAANNVLGALEDLVVEHDSQTAFVFSPFPAYHRAAILERRDRKAGSFAVAVYHPSPQNPVRLSHFISFCADMTETLTHKSLLDRVQEMIADKTIDSSPITPAFVQATRNRRRDLLESIGEFEKVNKVVYRPERPSFM